MQQNILIWHLSVSLFNRHVKIFNFDNLFKVPSCKHPIFSHRHQLLLHLDGEKVSSTSTFSSCPPNQQAMINPTYFFHFSDDISREKDPPRNEVEESRQQSPLENSSLKKETCWQQLLKSLQPDDFRKDPEFIGFLVLKVYIYQGLKIMSIPFS